MAVLIEKYLIVNNDGTEFVAVDYNSGGYPYWTSNVFDAKRFDNFSAASVVAKDYEKMWFIKEKGIKIALMQVVIIV